MGEISENEKILTKNLKTEKCGIKFYVHLKYGLGVDVIEHYSI